MEVKKAIKLGELIQKIENIAISEEKADYRVYFDFGNLVPTKLASWRGVYAYLALGYAEQSSSIQAPPIIDFLSLICDAVGKTYIGWKGGEYIMGLDTPIFVANQGRSGMTGIVEVHDIGYGVILETGRCWD